MCGLIALPIDSICRPRLTAVATLNGGIEYRRNKRRVEPDYVYFLKQLIRGLLNEK